MSYPDGFWTFVDGDGRIYGSSATGATAQQAWADFYQGEAPSRRKAEKSGCYCRPAESGDLEAFR